MYVVALIFKVIYSVTTLYNIEGIFFMLTLTTIIMKTKSFCGTRRN